MTKIIKNVPDWVALREKLSCGSVGFVPTMGHLHPGHAALIQRSQDENDTTVVSIYVNPTQFDKREDYLHYPSNLKHDIQLLSQMGVAYLLLPDNESMYPHQSNITLKETVISLDMEGQYRKGHFSGVLTILLKFINLVKPDRIYMGEKDYQQYLLTKKLVESFFMPTEVVCCATIRDDNGVAYSSRNTRLSPEGYTVLKQLPPIISQSLPCDSMIDQIESCGMKVDYVEKEFNRCFAAVRIESIRFIDNVRLAQENV